MNLFMHDIIMDTITKTVIYTQYVFDTVTDKNLLVSYGNSLLDIT